MANRQIFASTPGKLIPAADSVNEAGGLSYKGTPEEALAQYSCTGTFGHTYYASAAEQTSKFFELAAHCDPEYVAKVAIYAREKGLMKDAPVALVAHLTTRKDQKALAAAFRKVVVDTKSLRNFAQIIRTGVVGRKSFGTRPKKLCRELFDSMNPETLFFNSLGQAPTVGDVIKMVRPKGGASGRNAMYRWLMGKDYDGVGFEPKVLIDWKAWKASPTTTLPNAPLEMLTAEAGDSEDIWKQIALKATWNQTRQTLKAFERHGVFKDREMVEKIAAKLKDPKQIKKRKVMPYSVMTSAEVAEGINQTLYEAMLEAVDVTLENVPVIPGQTWIFVDVSGSMTAPVMGRHGKRQSTVQCRQVAALAAAAIAQANKGNTYIIPFSDKPYSEPTYSGAMDLYKKLNALPSGGTDCSIPLKVLNNIIISQGAKPDTCIYFSDNESWIDERTDYNALGLFLSSSRLATNTAIEFARLRSKRPNVRMICVDLAPNQGRQIGNSEAVLNIGGFSDNVFELISLFAENKMEGRHWKGEIEKVVL